MLKLIQGDSFRCSYSAEDFPDLDTNWSGTWKVSELLDSAAILNGTLTNTVTELELVILPATSETLSVRQYWLTAQIVNPVLGFKQEVQTALLITTQGIPT